jgi:ADP-ribosyl-[dinitrogen reductase] hydrolase
MTNTLLGGAIGDALGVPFESKPANNPLLLSWDQKSYLGSEHHKLEPGQFSDDTQFSMAVAESLIKNDGFNPDDLSKRYVELFTSKTIRGYGRTTLAAINNLIAGKHWSKSGIIGSYGNGSAMRAAPFGVWYRHDQTSLIDAVRIDSAITHASEEAEAGAIAIASAAALAANHDTERLNERIWGVLPDSEVKKTIYSLTSLVKAKNIPPLLALGLLGTKADVKQTVPSALYLFMKMNNYEEAVVAAIRAGQDTDTQAAITGALFAARDGIKDIPQHLISQIEDRDKLVVLDSQLYHRSNESFFPRS